MPTLSSTPEIRGRHTHATTQRAPSLPSGWQPAWLKRCGRAMFGMVYGGHDVKGVTNMPLSGPVIVAATHRSYLDPIIMSAFLPRTLYYMGKRELFRIPLLSTVIRRFGAFPIDRQGARGSTFRMALNVLRLGGALVIFPEGGIANAFNENRFKAGGRKPGQHERRARSADGHSWFGGRVQAAPGNRTGQPAGHPCRGGHPRVARARPRSPSRRCSAHAEQHQDNDAGTRGLPIRPCRTDARGKNGGPMVMSTMAGLPSRHRKRRRER